MDAKTQEDLHSDDLAVDHFATAMKAKLARSRQKGRGGWDDKTQCSGEHLANLLIEHLSKGNKGTFEDVANFAMMLHQRKENPELLAGIVRENSPRYRELKRDHELLNLWLGSILAEYKNTGGISYAIKDIDNYYKNNGGILPDDLQREFGVRTEAELTRLLEDRESRYAVEDPDDDEMIGNGVKISFVGGASKTTYNGKE
jgi:hypothetical protein